MRPTPSGSAQVVASRHDPFPAWKAAERDVQVGVDEQPAVVVQRGADAVAGVGGHQHPVARIRFLALDQRHPHPHPGGGGADVEVGPGDEPHVHRGVVADIESGLEERPFLGLLRAGRRCRGRRCGLQVEIRRPDPPRARPDDRRAAAAQGALDQLDAAPGADHLGLDLHRRDGYRLEDLERGACQASLGQPAHAVELTPEQRARRAGVLVPGVPGPAGQLGGGEPVSVPGVERLNRTWAGRGSARPRS